MTSLRLLLAVLTASLLLTACPSDDDDASDDDDSAVDDDDSVADDDDSMPDPEDVVLQGECPLAERFGRFAVEALPNYTAVQGQVLDGVVPITVLEEVGAEGGCTLMRRNLLVCEPPCDPGFACDFDGECITYPVGQDLGTVDVEGLVEPVSMEPAQPGYNYFFTSLPHPAILPGETVRLRSSGGLWDGFDVFGVGIEPLDLPEDALWSVEQGSPFDVTWPAAADGVRSHVYLTLNIDLHGISPARVFCEFPDTGAAQVPASIVDGLVGSGVSGFPQGTLTRRTADRADVGEGCVDFVVGSPRTVEVDVVGFIPCNPQTPCPDGMECNLALEICE